MPKSLKHDLIKLGYTNPELRDHIRPVLDTLLVKTSSFMHARDVRELIFEELVLQARNDSNAYKNRDARGAVEEAAKAVTKMFFSEMRGLKQKATEEVRKLWADNDTLEGDILDYIPHAR
jgi:hypothetical protein